MAKKEKTPPPAEESKKSAESPEAAAPAPKGGGKLKLIIIVVAAMVVGMGGAVAAMKFMGGSTPPPETEVATTAPASDTDSPPPIEAPRRPGSETAPPPAQGSSGAEGDPAAAESVGPINIEFKPFTVNLNDVSGKRYLKLAMSIEADNEALAGEINAKMPQFRDIILLLLSSLSYDDIATLDGKMRLRNQMLNRINTQLSTGKIKNIYFSEFVVQ